MLPSAVAVRGVLRPDPDQARAWVERELARPAYRRSLLDRLLDRLGEVWHDLTDAASGASTLSTAVAVVLAVLLLALGVLVVTRVRREPAATPGTDVLAGVQDTSPDEHRSAAEAALAEDRLTEALVEAFRALASRSVRRGLVEVRPGLTADELAAELAPAFPADAGPLDDAARLFDRVFYGDQPASPEDARSVLDLDARLRHARPAERPVLPSGPVPAVPR